MRAAIGAEFDEVRRTKPEPRIFWGFIFDERNRTVKEMALGARMNIILRPGTAWFTLKTGETGGTKPDCGWPFRRRDHDVRADRSDLWLDARVARVLAELR